MIGTSYRNANGDLVRIADIDGDVAIFENNDRVAVARLNDKRFFTEVYEHKNTYDSDDDAFSLTSNNSFRNNLLNDLQNVISRNDGNVSENIAEPLKIIESVVERHRDSVNTYAKDDVNTSDVERLKQKAIDSQKNLQKRMLDSHNALTSKVDLDPADLNFDPNVRYDTRETDIQYFDENNKVSNESLKSIKEDPIYDMFRKVKRSQPIKLSVNIDEMIPKKEFLSMWEDSYEISIIEHLAEEFTEKYLKNPNGFKSLIMQTIKDYVYGKEKRVVKKTNPVITPKTTTRSKRVNNNKEKTK